MQASRAAWDERRAQQKAETQEREALEGVLEGQGARGERGFEVPWTNPHSNSVLTSGDHLGRPRQATAPPARCPASPRPSRRLGLELLPACTPRGRGKGDAIVGVQGNATSAEVTGHSSSTVGLQHACTNGCTAA